MKFDICVGNPPYGKNLHLKIINTVINHLTEDGIASFIHPARWYEDPLAETKKKATDKVKFKDIVNKLERVEIIDVLTANSKFHIANETDLMISHINNKHTGGISSIYNTPFVKEALNCILKASNIDNLSNHIEYNKLDGYRCEIKKQQSFQSERPSRVDEYSRLKNVSIVLLNNNCFKDGYELDSGKWWGNCKKSDGGSPKPEGTPIPLSIHFDNENDLRNFVIGYNSKFIRNIFSILKFSSSVQFEYYPYIQMKKKWSDEDFCKFFGKLGMSKECQEWMCREVSDYRTKDFINYMKFDNSKLEEDQEYSETPVDPEDSSPSGSVSSKTVLDN